MLAGSTPPRLSLLLCAAALLLASSPASAAPPIRNGGNIGLGLGATTQIVGLDTKYWMNESMSFQMVLGSYGLLGGLDPLVLGVDADLLLELPSLYDSDDFDLGVNAGVGGIFASSLDVDMVGGANLIVGIEANIDAVPLDVGLDYRPAIFFLDDLDGLGGESFRLDLVEFGAHIRYWF